MSKKDSKKELKKREILYSYWPKIPLVVSIDTPVDEVLTHEVRTLIIYSLRKGKEEKWINGTKRIRHAFSVKEILDMANKKLDEEMKIQSMYFHLQKLQDYGLIDVVTTLHEGRHNIAYFGRTARGFVFESKKDKTKYDDYFAEAAKFAKALNSKVSEEQFKELLSEFKAINAESDKEIVQWLQEQAEFINENNIDAAPMFSLLRRINYQNSKMTALLEKVAELIVYEIK